MVNGDHSHNYDAIQNQEIGEEEQTINTNTVFTQSDHLKQHLIIIYGFKFK